MLLQDKNKSPFSGADYDDATGLVSPGLALYHHGMDLVALVCTDNDVYHLRVRGQLMNDTWVNMGIVYDPAGSMNKGDIKVRRRSFFLQRRTYKNCNLT